MDRETRYAKALTLFNNMFLDEAVEDTWQSRYVTVSESNKENHAATYTVERIAERIWKRM